MKTLQQIIDLLPQAIAEIPTCRNLSVCICPTFTTQVGIAVTLDKTFTAIFADTVEELAAKMPVAREKSCQSRRASLLAELALLDNANKP
jgi:hypothetical protein